MACQQQLKQRRKAALLVFLRFRLSGECSVGAELNHEELRVARGRVLGIGLMLLLPFVATGGGLLADLVLPQHWLQFGLIVGCLIWLLRSLRRHAIAWDSGTILLLLAGISLLLTAFFRDSVWFAKVSFCFAASLAAGSLPQPSRAKLLLLLLVAFAGLPPVFAGPIDGFVSERLALHMSTLFSLLGAWNYRSGGVLTTEQGVVDIGALLASPTGFSGLLAIVACWMLLRQWSVIQSLLLSAFAMPVAVLNFVCSCLIALLVSGSMLDRVPIGLWSALLTLPALLFLYSALELIAFLTSAILLSNTKGAFEARQNPLNRLWDRLISDRPFDVVGPIRLLVPNSWRLSGEVRPLGFFMDWLGSRRLRQLPGAIPALALAVCIPLADSLLMTRRPQIFTMYEQQLLRAREEHNVERSELLLRGLVGQRPRDLQRRLQLADFLWNQRSPEAGWAEYSSLALLDGTGAAEAHLWVARNAMSPSPFRTLPDKDLIKHLQRALQIGGSNGEAHSLLASLYLKVGEITLAEDQLRKAAIKDPRYFEDLLIFCQRRGRPLPAGQIEQVLRDLFQQLQTQPDAEALRIRLARLLVLTNRIADAEKLIADGRQRLDSVPLRTLAAELRLLPVEINFFGSALPGTVIAGDDSLVRVRESLKLDPASEMAPLLAALLHLEWARFDGHADAALQYWQSKLRQSEDPLALRSLARLTFACGRPAEALDIFARLPQRRPEDAVILVTALMRAGRKSDAAVEAKSSALPLLSAGTVAGRVSAADLFSRAGEFREAEQCLQEVTATDAENRLLLSGRARLALDELDSLLGYPGAFRAGEGVWTPQVPDGADERVLRLIEISLLSSDLYARLADRLYLLTLQGGRLGPLAEDALRRCSAGGGDVAGILSAIGSRALQREHFESAIRWLRLAQTLAKTQNPVLQNNLAVAIVRGGPHASFEEALKLADSAVQALPGNHMVLATRGEVYLALNDPKRAREDLDAALQLRPDYSETLRLLARTADLQGLVEEAEAFRRRADELRPSNP